jgi:tetratricopeptide (TPR) repeat protein
VIERYGADSGFTLRDAVARSMLNQGVRLGLLKRYDEAIAVYDELSTRFADDPEPAVRARAAKALSNKGHLLGALGRNDEALALYDEVVARYGGEDPDDEIDEALALALFDTPGIPSLTPRFRPNFACVRPTGAYHPR